MAPLRRTEIQAKYDKANTRAITFKLNLNYDADILEQLDAVENRQGYIKELIRADIARRASGISNAGKA